MVAFRPLEPSHTAGFRLQSIRIHVRDHKLRELAIEDRTLEAHYGGFVLSQSKKGASEARRLALDVSYGQAAREGRIAGPAALDARACTGADREPRLGDIDGAQPIGGDLG